MELDTLLKGVDSIDKLKCKTCNNLLSYFPIQISADNKSICGRCTQVDNQHRNEAYEAIAQVIQFPCRYEGCPEKILPKNMPKHEQACPHRIVKCPVIKQTRCNWNGSFLTVLQHCQEQHSELFVKHDTFFVVNSTSSQVENLLEFDRILFIVSTRLDLENSIFKCSICRIEDGLPLKSFSCIVANMDYEAATLTKSNNTGFVEIPLNALSKNSRICAKLIVQNSSSDSVQEKINEKIIFQLTCSVCSEYALPPIYHDKNNKVQCSSCIDEDTNPPRNYALDNIASLLFYPCKYRESGCTSVLKAEEMKKHQKFCQYGSFTCPVNEYVKCEWTGLKSDVMNHLQRDHQDMVKDNFADIAEHYTPDIFTKCYIVRFGNYLFKLVFSIDEAKQEYDEENDKFVAVHRFFRWTVQTIGHHNDDFMYEIEIADSNNKGRKLTARQLCQPLTQHEELFDNENYCSFSFEQTRSLVTKNDKITFKISILK